MKRPTRLFKIISAFLALGCPLVAGAQNASYNLNTVPIGGTNSSGFGPGALITNTGTANTAIGTVALKSNTSGYDNSAVGFKALGNNTTGINNSAVGSNALVFNITGVNNTGVGYSVLYSNTSGDNNTGQGVKTLYSNTTGSANTAHGAYALYSNTTGWYNTAGGRRALYSNTTGSSNSANGEGSLYSNTTGSSNSANGYLTLYSNTTGSYNVAAGAHALGSNTVGSNNSAVGTYALYFNTSGSKNAACGFYALNNNTTGANNAACGAYALRDNTTGSDNAANGYNALAVNTTGFQNTANGSNALYYNSTGQQNTGAGCVSLFLNSTGNYNSASGYRALYSNTTGHYNTAIGAWADVSSGATFNNATALGNGAVVNAGNKVRLGNASVTVIEGQVAYSYPSDGRFKTNIKEEDVKGLEFIKKLRPVVYNFDTRKFTEFLTKNMSAESRQHYLEQDFSTSTKVRQSGFIAQEVEQAAKAVQYDFNGVHAPANENDNYSIAYSEFVVPLVKGMQEQQQMIEEQKQIIENQTQKIEDQDQKIEKLEQQVNRLLKNQGLTADPDQAATVEASMEQNVPNPFTYETVIGFNLPQSVSNASLVVYDLSGKQLKSLPIQQRGNASMTITADQLAAGMYIYSIVADGKILSSKRMVVADK